MIQFDRFVFSDETATLSGTEFEVACAVLDAIEKVRTLDAPALAQPQAGWADSRASFQHAERDGVQRNFRTSYKLLAEKDRDVVGKLRLYTQTFSGYQLATLRLAEAHVPWIGEKLPKDYDKFLAILAGARDRWVDAWFALAETLPETLHLTLPARFGEIGWKHGQHLINHDAHAYLTRVAMMHELGILSRMKHAGCPRVLEIGGGFGGLAWMLMQVLPPARYVIVDLPESLAFAAVYLSVLFPALHNTVVSNRHEAEEVSEGPGFTFALFHCLRFPHVDLAINTLSFAEMTAVQVTAYGQFIAGNLAPGGVLYEQNNEYSDERSEALVQTVARCFRQGKQMISTHPARTLYGPARVWT